MTTAGIEAQTSVLGSILIEPRCLSAVRQEITADMFPYDHQRDIFEAACQLQDEGQPVDPVTIKAKVQTNGGKWENRYVLDLMDLTPTAANVMEYCKLLRQDAMARALEEQTRQASEDLRAGQDPFTVAQELTAALEAISAVENTSSTMDGVSAMVDLHEVLTKAEEKPPVHPTGYRKLDKLLGGGFIDGCLYILAARPGQGKTTLGINIAERLAFRGERVLFVTLEMTVPQISARRIAAHVGTVTASQVITGDLCTEDMKRVVEAMAPLSERQIIFNRRNRIAVQDVQFLARQNQADLVVIDYLGLLQYEPGRSLYERVTATSNRLKKMSIALNIPILCLAQLNRETEGRKGPPRLSDLRDSGAVEQDADVVMLLHRPDDQVEQNAVKLELLDVRVAKNRYGAAGVVTLGWCMKNGRVVENGGG